MNFELTVKCKEMAIENMTKNLVTLRTMLHLTQAELASLIGVGRQTLIMIEKYKRKMTWSVFLSLLFIFSHNKETDALLEIFGIYNEQLKKIFSSI